MLWEEHPEVEGKLDDLFWEDQKVWYKCIDEKNEGIILEQAKVGEIQVCFFKIRPSINQLSPLISMSRYIYSTSTYNNLRHS